MNDKTKQNRQLGSARSSRSDEKYIFDMHRPREAQTPSATPAVDPSQPSDTHQGWRAEGELGEGALQDSSILEPSVLDSLGGNGGFGHALGDGTRDTVEIANTANGVPLDPVSGLPLCSLIRMPRRK